MNQLKDIQANVDSTVTNLIASGANEGQVLINFEIQLERAQVLLRQIANATNLDHGIRNGLISVEQATVLKQAIEYILTHTDYLVNDLNNINGSGIHEIIEPNRFTMIVASILETANQRYVGESLWRTVCSKFKKITHFSDLYKTKPNGKAYDFEGDQLNDLQSLPLMNREPELQQAS